MSAAEKISVRVGDITIKATQKTTAKALLAHALDQAGAVSIARHPANDTTPPALGELWPEQGGIYAGLMRGEDGRPDYHLVAAADEAGQLKGAWGCSGIEIKGSASRNDGLANTTAMAEAGSDLAKKMLALEIDGHADWYLPAQAELMLCFANAREHFPKEWHWSSTQSSANCAWGQGFSYGTADIGAKGGEWRARAVRRVEQ